jgi:hypothetical protein
MRAEAYTRDCKPLAEGRKIPLEVPNGQFGVVACAEGEAQRRILAGHKPKQQFAKFKRHRYYAMLAAFPEHVNGEIVEIEILSGQS